MVDFSALLRKPAGEAKKPPTLPPGDYQAVIKSFAPGDDNQNKTPYIRFIVGLMDWPADAPDEWSDAQEDGTVVTVTRGDVELSKRQMRRDYYLTEDSLFRLDDLIRSCGIEAAGRAYEEVLPEMIGQQVLATVKQGLNQQTNKIFVNIDKLTGVSG